MLVFFFQLGITKQNRMYFPTSPFLEIPSFPHLSPLGTPIFPLLESLIFPLLESLISPLLFLTSQLNLKSTHGPWFYRQQVKCCINFC